MVDRVLGLAGTLGVVDDPALAKGGGGPHCDVQWLRLPWLDPASVDGETRTLSFTLPLELPGGGGGLWTWPVRHDELVARGATHEDTLALAANLERSYWPYEPGHLYETRRCVPPQDRKHAFGRIPPRGAPGPLAACHPSDRAPGCRA